MAGNAVDWDEVEKSFISGEFKSIEALCSSHGITKGQFYYRWRLGNWAQKVPKRPPRRKKKPLARLRDLAERKIEAIERQGVSSSSVANLTALLRLIERIIALEHREEPVARRSKPAAADGRRRELARRIEAIQRQLELEGDRQPAER